MIIDGVEYVKKENTECLDLSNYMIIDPCNVLAIVPIDKNFYFDDIFEIDIPKKKLTYKLISDELIPNWALS